MSDVSSFPVRSEILGDRDLEDIASRRSGPTRGSRAGQSSLVHSSRCRRNARFRSSSSFSMRSFLISSIIATAADAGVLADAMLSRYGGEEDARDDAAVSRDEAGVLADATGSRVGADARGDAADSRDEADARADA